ncbi:MAG: 7-carboxy-7-deazaguanine synthase QueE [bacterium]|nr:7-carboxy-7-deazaguanine synthase QueE [bacterium]
MTGTEIGAEAGSPPVAAASARAPLVEIFESIQGEGRFVGMPTTFVRTATCPLRCVYCDTQNSYEAAPQFPVQLPGQQRDEANPVSAVRVDELLARSATAGCVSLTGGEPLVFPAFVAELGQRVRARGVRLHLETAAIHPDALHECVEHVDHLSADYKLPVTLGDSPGPTTPATEADGGHGERHVECLRIAVAAGATVDCKIVLTPAVTAGALTAALSRLQPLREQLVLVLQPVTPCGDVTEALSIPALQSHLRAARAAGFDVRVLPQVHRLLDLP